MIACMIDILLSLVVLVGQPVCFTDKGYMVKVSSGFFSGRSELFDHITGALLCILLHTNIMFVVVMFLYRYRMLCHKEEKHGTVRRMRGTLVLVAAWCIFQVVNSTRMFMFDISPKYRKIGLDIMDSVGWNYDHATPPYPSVAYVWETKGIVHNCMYIVSVIGGYSVIIWCEIRMMAYLRQFGTSFRENTRKQHKEVNRALVALAIAPLFSMIAPIFVWVVCAALSITLGPVSALITVMMSLTTVANPLTIMYFIVPYRRAICRLFCGWKHAQQTARVSAVTSNFGISNDTQENNYNTKSANQSTKF
ncbi:serpentine type 7TM GPCR chemoreceptor str domain-containing protein [Ditylenchus destructor]|nr:serpentine type 7TM GPCR chemoreceptor str domain-containing protein [Ditylenchus destructor]